MAIRLCAACYRTCEASRFSGRRFGARFLSACKVPGPAPLRTLTIHHGRHTFIHALAGGRTLAEVRAAAGHSNVAITSGYLHVVVDEDEDWARYLEQSYSAPSA